MWTGGFPEPLTFSLRARRYLSAHAGRFDVVHDNQTLGYGLLGLDRLDLPLVTTVHHPVQVDRALELAAARGWRQLSLRRWYAFTRMQRRVARRLPDVLTVSEASAAEIAAHLAVPAERIHIVPIGVDTDRFRSDPATPRVPGRVVTTASADVPLKGLVPLIEALAKVRTERPAELVVIGSPRDGGPVAAAIDRFDLAGAVRFRRGISEAELVHELRSAEVAVVPSLYEGFSLPAVEAMACGTPLVATTGGALPEVAGRHGESALLVPPGDAGALASALARLLDDAPLRQRLSVAGRARVLERFTWSSAATRTVARYRAAIAAGPARDPGRAMDAAGLDPAC
jgi:glycosyltransferase involved in cell wall biosynthesis